MNAFKKTASLFMAIAIIFTAVPITFSASGEGIEGVRTAISDNDACDLSLSFPVTTQNDGKLWVNKAVSHSVLDCRDSNGVPYQFDGAQLEAVTAPEDGFVVSLMALAQSFKRYTEEEDRTDLNVVFVMDMSTSMTNSMSKEESSQRITVLQSAAQSFIDKLAGIGDGTQVNLAMISYMGSATTIFNWSRIGTQDTTNAANTAEAHNAVRNIKSGKYYYSISNTNTQAGLYLANYLFDTANSAEIPEQPTNINSDKTQNFVIFMSDGGPNRYFTSEDISVTKNANGYYRLPGDSAISPIIFNTDYKQLAAIKTFDEAEKISQKSNMTFYSLGLSAWFTSEAYDSTFPTAVNLLKLCAAVGNKVITKEEASGYCLADIPNGGMKGSLPSYPDINPDDFKTSDTNWQIKWSASGMSNYSTLEAFQAAFDARFGDLETRRQTQGINSIPPDLNDQINNYYAGNSATKFNASFSDIGYHILMSMSEFVTNVETSTRADVSGYVYMTDNIGEYMEVKEVSGIIDNGTLYNGKEFAQKFSNLDWLYEDSIINDSFRRSLYDRCGIPSDRDNLITVFEAAINSGTIYYNSDEDYSNELWWYADVNSKYLGNYYNADGSENEQPANAVFKIKSYFTWGSADGSLVPNAQMFYLTVAVVENLMTNNEFLVLSIPASIMPVRSIDVEFTQDGARAYVSDDTLPISLFYKVGLRENLTDVADDYIYTTEDSDGNPLYNFYSNMWREHQFYPGGYPAYAAFAPNDDNPYYYNVKGESKLYLYNGTAELFEEAHVFDFDLAYYYKTSYYDESGEHDTYVRLYGEYETLGNNIDPNEYVYVNPDDNCVYGKIGAPRISELNYTQLDKTFFADGNVTGTKDFYKHYYYTLMSTVNTDRSIPYETDVVIQLGNNGKLTLNNVDTTITKVWEDGNNFYNTRPTSVTLDVYRDGEFYETITVDSTDASTCTVSGNVWKFTYTVPFGHTYTFTERAVADYRTEYSEDGYTITNSLFIDDNTAVLDYGLTTLLDIPEYKGIEATDVIIDTAASTLNFGTASAQDGKIAYTPSTTSWNGYDTVKYTAILGDANNTEINGTYYVMPATSVYYEESFLNFTSGGNSGWTQVGTASGEYQDSGTADSFVYGSDPAYSADSGYSGGSAMKTTVSSSDTSAVWPKASFDFYGTMIELISATSRQTGFLTVKVRDYDTGKVVDATPINTVYEDETYGELEQIPVYRCDLGTYGHYSVEITAAYSKYFDTFNLGSYDIIIDAICIYNPAGTSLASGKIHDKYLADNELNPVFGQIRDCFISDDTGSLIQGGTSPDYTGATGAMYVACGDGITGIAQYETDGPNYEVYLRTGNAVAFRINGFSVGDELHISAKTPNAVPGAKSNAVLTVNGMQVDFVDSAAEQYFDITDYMMGGVAVITNSGAEILSLVNFKIIDGGEIGANSLFPFSDDEVFETASGVLGEQSVSIDRFALPESLRLDAAVVCEGRKTPFTTTLDTSDFTVRKVDGEWVAEGVMDKNNPQFLTAVGQTMIPYDCVSPKEIIITASWDGNEWTAQSVDIIYTHRISGDNTEQDGISFIRLIIKLITDFFRRIFGLNGR